MKSGLSACLAGRLAAVGCASAPSYLVVSQTPDLSAVQFQLDLGPPRSATAFQILHNLWPGMVRPDQIRIGGNPAEYIKANDTYGRGRTRDKAQVFTTWCSPPVLSSFGGSSTVAASTST